MDLEEVAVYRRELQNYKYYQRELKKHQDKKLELETIELGLHGMKIEGVAVQGSQDPLYKSLKRHDLMKMIDDEEYEIINWSQKIRAIDKDLMLMNEEIATTIKNVYCLKKTTIYKESRKIHMDVSTLKRHINKEIWKVIKIRK